MALPLKEDLWLEETQRILCGFVLQKWQLLSSLAFYTRMNVRPQVDLLSIVAKNYDSAITGWEGIIIDL